MPTITINGTACEFTPGQTILQVANQNGIEIPQYCYHDGLSVVASCRICLADVWAPNPRNENKLEPYMGGKLHPTCQTAAGDGMVVRSDSPASIANQKAVMEYLLINHPLDCPVCDQAGECSLQDYSYEYGSGESRFEEQKVKQPKKDVGPHVYLYADRCIMCTRCVRFTREVTATSELMVLGRGNKEEIDIFPGQPLANELSANVIDLCPVGALLDKDFLFAQRVWFLHTTPTIDGITASGDNIYAEHNEGKVYRIKPRTNMAVNTWWITDEVRYGWHFVHSEKRLRTPRVRRQGSLVDRDYARAYEAIAAATQGKAIGLMVSPMLTCEDAYALATLARSIDPNATLALGPVPVQGQDKTFPGASSNDKPFTMYAEKAPNARGVKRVLDALCGNIIDAATFEKQLAQSTFQTAFITGNYPSTWATDTLLKAITTARTAGCFVVVIDTLASKLTENCDVLLPGATWLEKSGTFENARNQIQSFEAAIPVIEMAKTEGQLATDLQSVFAGEATESSARSETIVVDRQDGQVAPTTTIARPRTRLFNPADTRTHMAAAHASLKPFITDVSHPTVEARQQPDMEIVEL
jgi:NADH-quinone oxidoreductase subunit G